MERLRDYKEFKVETVSLRAVTPMMVVPLNMTVTKIVNTDNKCME